MKAAICYEFGQPLVVEEVEIDEPHEGEVKVRLAAAAVCHSDVHLMHGDWAGGLPVVPGHEASGIVEAVGARVSSVQPGDRVVVSLLRSCGRCFHCTRGSAELCEHPFALNTESRLRNRRGKPLVHGIRVAAFAEEVVVDQSQVVRIRDEMPFDRAALLGCGVITGFGAVRNTARVGEGASVAVIGAGGVGLNVVQAAIIAGAATVIAIDRLDAKLVAARSFGATEAINSIDMEPRDLSRRVRKLTAGRGADFAFVTVGNADAVGQALMLIRPGGTVVAVGMPPNRATTPLRVAELVWSGQRLLGCRMGATRLAVDVPHLVDLYLSGRLELDRLITARYPLDRINEAIAAMETGESLRNVVVF